MAAELVVVAATPLEMSAVFEGAGIASSCPPAGGYLLAETARGPARFVVSGVGPLAAAFAAGRLAGEGLLAPERCRGVVCLGLAGSYDASQAPLGALVLATREVWPEYGVATDGVADPVALGFPLLGEAAGTALPLVWNSMDLDPLGALAAMRLRAPSHVAGTSVTVSGVSGNAARAALLAKEYSALSENMEGFSLALASLRAGVSFAEIRSISNAAGDRSKVGWDIPLALRSLSRAAMRILAGKE